MRGLALAAVLSLWATAAAAEMVQAEAGILRWIDRLTGESGDMELARGQSASNGRLTIKMDECRYPADNPAGDAEAHLTISDSMRAEPVFQGWMIASSPALSALDHPRYDVWVLSCVYPNMPVIAPAEGQ
ncbi:MAG: DUF2155 domain-containing protein [Pseudomonadota bacterium]